MISIKMEEAAAFDILSVFQVKMYHMESEKVTQQYYSFCDELEVAVGNAKFLQVMQSDEYMKLLCINSQLFRTIEYTRKGVKLDASIIDTLNYDRYEAKKEIQSSYFDQDYEEVKSPLNND